MDARPPELPAAERRAIVARRLELVREILDRRAADALLLSTRRTFAWLTAGGQSHVAQDTETGAASLLVTRDAAIVLAPNIEVERLRDEELDGLPFEVVSVPWFEARPAHMAIAALGGRDPTPEGSIEADLGPLRVRLEPFEHGRLAWLGRAVTRALDGALSGARPGEREDEVAGRLLAELAKAGVRAPVLLAGADERITRHRHPLPTSLPARRRLMLVVVGERWGLHVALTRIREFEAPTPEIARRLDLVVEVLEAMLAATRPGARLGDVLEAARAAYAAAGRPDEWRHHHQGGPIGYRSREWIVTPGDPTVIETGMAFAWNPSITGAKAEATIVVGVDGAPVTIAPAAE